MRRLLFLASAVVFVDTMFFAAVVPLLPGLSDAYGLSKPEAGLLSGSYAAGTLVAALPGGFLAAKVGGRTTLLVGLSVMTVTGVAFALADSYALLASTRFLQGAGGACSWAGALGWLVTVAPRERRGELIGSAMAAAIAGVLFGPALGGAADAVGRGPMFTGVALAGLGLIALTLRMPPPPKPDAAVAGGLRVASGSAAVRLGMMIILVPGMIFGAIEVLLPLELDDLGATATAIAATFLVAAALEAVVSPLAGRFSDRRGRVLPSAVGLVASAVTMLLLPLPGSAWLLAVTFVIASPAIGVLWAPGMAMLADGAEQRGVPQGLAFGILNLGWGLGHTIGAVGGPALGDATSDQAAYGVLAVVCVAALATLMTRTEGVGFEPTMDE